MAIDLSRFRQTFLEESREGLDTMEEHLLRLEQGSTDAELINTIFRAAHSIKGGAGTFGFTEVGQVTHLLETLLDEMRSGKRGVTEEAVTVLLESVDVVRTLLGTAERGEAADREVVSSLSERLSAVLKASTAAPAAPAAAQAAQVSGWRIRFAPHAGMLGTGNEPIRILRELGELGPVQVEADLSKLPSLADVDAESAYLAWNLTLNAGVPKARVEEVFAWVDGECELKIEPIAAVSVVPKGDPQAPEATVARVPTAERAAVAANTAGDGSIRVNVEKVDALINLVGELVITQAMLKQLSSALDPVVHEKLVGGLEQLARNTRDLQDAVMSVRMLPVGTVFNRFPRVVRDLASRLGKQVRLKLVGEATELDKGVIEKIADPLNHLVRNAVDHGVEMPADRLAAGKEETGTVTLKASHQGGYIVIEVADDGRGLKREKLLKKAAERGIAIADNAPDQDVWQLIFAPGFSTAEQVTDVSGRGVGMDVVKKNIVSLGGNVEIVTQGGQGLSVIIRLPLTLAILDGMSVAVGEEMFIIPLNFVVESLQPRREDVKSVQGQGRLLKVRNEYVPLQSMHDLFGVGKTPPPVHEGIVVILEAEGRKLAVQVDELVGQQQVVIKSLESNYRRIFGISGATIMGDGRVALIVDVGSLTRASAKAA
ncbi:MAG TPA: chemotaxis protein CheW [Nevskiaceae bacterium]|nr:chemotaxis protein CheW [Nevskiaceae bacterium]